MRANDFFRRVGEMNNIRACVEGIICKEVIFV